MSMIKLTEVEIDGSGPVSIHVRASAIVRLVPLDGLTQLAVVGPVNPYTYVKETVEEVLALMLSNLHDGLATTRDAK